MAAGQGQGRAGVKAHVRLAHHRVKAREAHVAARIAHLHQLLAADRVITDGGAARGRFDAGQAIVGLEPLALLVDQGDQGHRRAGELGRGAGQRIEQRFWRGIQQTQVQQPLQALAFVVGFQAFCIHLAFSARWRPRPHAQRGHPPSSPIARDHSCPAAGSDAQFDHLQQDW